MGAAVLSEKVLVLNCSYLAVHVTSVRRALTLLFLDLAHAVDLDYRTFDFASWRALPVAPDTPAVGLISGSMRAPRVVLLRYYDRLPRRSVRFSRFNVYARDDHRCQYCGRRRARSELNLDHVIPRALGGVSSWDNVVCSCRRCNRVKGGRTPDAAGMRLRRMPRRPTWSPALVEGLTATRYKEWLPYLGAMNGAQWGGEEDGRGAHSNCD